MGKFGGFTSVQMARPQRSDFDLSHFVRSTTRMGRLTPVFLSEALPGDTFRGNTEVLLRLLPLLAPIYDQINMYVHFFFVPNRLLWEEWEEFITGGRLGPGSVDPVAAPIPPYIDIEDLMEDGIEYCGESQLLDYLGVPPSMFAGPTPDMYAGIHLDMMPVLAYQRVWYDWYRDRNYISDDVMEFPVISGDIQAAFVNWEQYFQVRIRSYLHDYFTSALPFTQRGAEVMLPVSVTGDLPLYANPPGGPTSSMTLSGIAQPGSISVGVGVNIDEVDIPSGDIVARLDNISSATSINDFRASFALQVWYERNAVGGSRYVESTEAHFGVKPQDARLQNAEYLGGGRIQVTISEIVSTAYSQDADDETVPLANMAGHGKAYGNTNTFRYFCPEHGFVIGIASIMNPPSYHQGLSKMWRRRSFLDYAWPTFAKLGEQQVDKAELYASPDNLTEDENGVLPLFGYQSRYSDWKVLHNANRGGFHTSFLFWTLTREFGAPGPELGNDFVQFDDATQDRIFAVNTGTDNFLMYINNNVHVRRCLPYFGSPNNLGFQ